MATDFVRSDDAPVLRTRRFRTADGVALSIQMRGDPRDPVLILLHGGGANASWWQPMVGVLGSRRFLVALDFRGHGDSDHPEERVVGAFHRDVESLVAHLGSEGIVGDAGYALVGHSMGAHVAIDHAARHPEVAALVAIEPSRGARKNDSRRARLALAARRTYRTRAEAIERYRFLPDAGSAPESLRVEIAERSIRRDPATGRYGYKFDPRWFLLPSASPAPRGDVACPLLLIRGERSGLLTAEGARSLQRELPDARLLEVPDAGHNVHLERPGTVAQAILDHLDAGRGTSG